MDYRNLAKEELTMRPQIEASLSNTRMELAELEDEMRKKDIYCTAVLEAMAERRSELRLRLMVAKSRARRVDRALDTLDEDSRALLSVTFIEREDQSDIMEEFSIEKTTYYRLRGEALEKFTRALYGVVIS